MELATARRVRTVTRLLAGGLAVAWFLLLAPTSLGGRATFVVVDGTSMQPKYVTGDLVVAHRQDHYALGEIVVFRYGGGRVVHRLVGGDAQHGWTTQGINKPAPDTWTIPERDVLGRVWLHVPHVRRWIAWTHTPAGLALLVAALSVTATTSGGRRRRRPPSPLLQELLQMTTDLPEQTSTWRPAVPAPLERRALDLATVALALGCLLLGLATTFVTAGGRLRLAGVDLPATPTRAVGLAVAVAGALLAAPLSARVHLAWGGDPVDRAAARLRTKLVRVRALPLHLDAVVLEDAGQLLRVARQERLPVLHLPGEQHRFVVASPGAAYELVVTASGPAPLHRTSAGRDESVPALVPAGR